MTITTRKFIVLIGLIGGLFCALCAVTNILATEVEMMDFFYPRSDPSAQTELRFTAILLSFCSGGVAFALTLTSIGTWGLWVRPTERKHQQFTKDLTKLYIYIDELITSQAQNLQTDTPLNTTIDYAHIAQLQASLAPPASILFAQFQQEAGLENNGQTVNIADSSINIRLEPAPPRTALQSIVIALGVLSFCTSGWGIIGALTSLIYPIDPELLPSWYIGGTTAANFYLVLCLGVGVITALTARMVWYLFAPAVQRQQTRQKIDDQALVNFRKTTALTHDLIQYTAFTTLVRAQALFLTRVLNKARRQQLLEILQAHNLLATSSTLNLSAATLLDPSLLSKSSSLP